MNKNLVLGSLLTGVVAALATSSAFAQSSNFRGSITAYPNAGGSASTVYSAEALPNIFYSSANMFGDEVNLGGAATDRTIASISFEYYANYAQAGGITLSLFANDGVGGAPGTLIDSFSGDIQNGGANFNVNFAYNVANVIPDTLTWAVQFAGVGGANSAGLIANATALTGSSPNTFWENQGGNWVEQSIVPEPTTVALASVGGVAFLGMLFMRRNRK